MSLFPKKKKTTVKLIYFHEILLFLDNRIYSNACLQNISAPYMYKPQIALKYQPRAKHPSRTRAGDRERMGTRLRTPPSGTAPKPERKTTESSEKSSSEESSEAMIKENLKARLIKSSSKVKSFLSDQKQKPCVKGCCQTLYQWLVEFFTSCFAWIFQCFKSLLSAAVNH